MKLYIGADHRGFDSKQYLLEHLGGVSVAEVVDMGASRYDAADDYVDIARAVVNTMDAFEDNAVLLCGSGHGMEIVANRHRGIRAILGFNLDVVTQGREHENANVLVIPADWVDGAMVVEMVQLFLETDFSGEERHVRRLKKLEEV